MRPLSCLLTTSDCLAQQNCFFFSRQSDHTPAAVSMWFECCFKGQNLPDRTCYSWDQTDNQHHNRDLKPKRWDERDKGKNVHPKTGHEGPERDWMYRPSLSLTSTLDGVGGQRHAPAALPPVRPGTHCIEGWVGPRAGLDGCGKSRPQPGFDPRTIGNSRVI
jgi:hypothetical protein